MFEWLFGRKRKTQTEAPCDTYIYSDDLLFQWDVDSEGWTTDLGTTGTKAYIGPARENYDPPLESSCELVIRANQSIADWQHSAATLLVNQLSASDWLKKKDLGVGDFSFAGLELFEHEGRPDTCQLLFETELDREHIYRVHVEDGEAVDFGMDG